MSEIKINRLTNGNLYSEGKSLLGRVEEIQLPGLKTKTTDVNVLGLKSPLEMPAGFEKMTGKVKFNAVYPENFAAFGNPYKSVSVQFRGNLETYNSADLASEDSVVAFMRIRFKDPLAAITMKANDNPEQECEYTCTYIRLEIAGQRILEYDSFTNVFFVIDEDVFKSYKQNLGY